MKDADLREAALIIRGLKDRLADLEEEAEPTGVVTRTRSNITESEASADNVSSGTLDGVFEYNNDDYNFTEYT